MTVNSLFKISATIALVSISYFLGSVFLKGGFFYIFDAIWRLSIIFFVVVVAKFKPGISTQQWFIVILLFCIELIVYAFLAPTMPLIRIAISVVFAPILEELLFRGWVINKIEGSNKEKILYSSIFFGVYHLKNAYVLTLPALIYQIGYAAVFVGPIFAWVRLRYNSIFASIILHSGNNAVADTITPKFFPLLVKRNIHF
ncbi:CPBP family intramembrane metalloprotease [Candidatus Woesebacteria bacterium]|nr:CPBP family intramembrane metalloprotease [Candidatus Woesebacteria bacterium]